MNLYMNLSIDFSPRNPKRWSTNVKLYRPSQREAQHGDVTIRTFRFETGYQEIVFKTPEVIPGAGPITQARVYRAAPGHPWIADTRTQREAYRGRLKHEAVKTAFDYSQKVAAENRARFKPLSS